MRAVLEGTSMRRQVVVGLLAAGLVLSFGSAVGADASEPAPAGTSQPAAAPAGSGPRVSFSGGDLVTLRRPVRLSSARTGTGWRNVTVAGRAGIPAGAAQSVVLAVTATKAKAAGEVLARPVDGSSQPVLAYPREAAVTGTALVRLGSSGQLQLSATAGRPRLRVDVVGWVPRMAGIVTPTVLAGAVGAKVTKKTRTVRLAGRHGIPTSASALWVALRTTTKKAGTFAWAPAGKAPADGVALAKGTATWAVLMVPNAAGRISLRMSNGKARARLQVLGWALPGSSVHSGRPGALQRVATGKARKLKVGGRAGVPAAANVAALTLTGDPGTKVTVGGQRVLLGVAPASVVVPLTKGKVKVNAKAPKAKKSKQRNHAKKSRAAMTVTGWSVDPGDQSVSYVPKTGTHVLGPSDVVSANDSGTVVLEATADRVRAGDFLLVRLRSGPPRLGRVESVTKVAAGRQQLQLSDNASLADAFADYQGSYHGPASQPVSAAHVPASGRMRTAGADAVTASRSVLGGVGIALFGGDDWGCSSAVGAVELPLQISTSWDGDIDLDVSLAARTFDLSVRGVLTVAITGRTSQTITCSVSASLPVEVLLGTTGLAASFGGQASLSYGPEHAGSSTAVTFTGTTRTYASVWAYGSRSGGTRAMGNFGSVTPSGDRAKLTLELGMNVSVGVLGVLQKYLPVRPSAALTVGAAVELGPADSHNNSYQLLGPRCLDATGRAFVEVGAGIATDFFPDISVSIARYDSPRKTLYRGPCYGYSGTISFKEVGDGTYGGQAMSAEHTLTRTLVPQAAGIGLRAGDTVAIAQPSTWNGLRTEVYHSPVPGYPDCKTTYPKFFDAGIEDWQSSPGPVLAWLHSDGADLNAVPWQEGGSAASSAGVVTGCQNNGPSSTNIAGVGFPGTVNTAYAGTGQPPAVLDLDFVDPDASTYGIPIDVHVHLVRAEYSRTADGLGG
ncbi:MAG TPA: hypothetical protein VFN19_05435 [Candidatus Nanopelagicales bacterium]|nr:hypothetical protein [Candidatus Nanopelagicales bacterium]